MFGENNTDSHELDFFTRDAQNRFYFWAYRHDKVGHTLQRYLYASPDSKPVADGPPLNGITNFFAQTYPITALQDSHAPVYSALYKDATLQPYTSVIPISLGSPAETR